MVEKTLLKDQLFNATTIGQLALEYRALPGFDAERFQADVLSGFATRELMARLDWIADCLEPYLATDFPSMAEQLEACMPERLNPTLRDDDFGQFIHAVPGILAVRHGLEGHCARALDLLYEATQRFSMEFYIRPFLNHWPEETLDRLQLWAQDDNYHVRRLVSEGTRPKLPWAKAITLKPAQTLPLLDMLHADGARFVTRSVANHLNDIGKTEPDLVLELLARWQAQGLQQPKELDWMTRHALRSLIKSGHTGALEMLGYVDCPETLGTLTLHQTQVEIGGALNFAVTVESQARLPVLVDYILELPSANAAPRRKVYKLKTGMASSGAPFEADKRHVFKGDATTFQLYPGPARLALQVNGRILCDEAFQLLAPGGPG